MNHNRALSVIEQAMELLNRQNGSFNIVTISRIKGEISEGILRQALDAIQGIHPLLRSRIVGTLDNLEFTNEGTGKIPLYVASQGENESWQDVVREELNKTIDSSNVLLRCILLYKQSETNTSYLITTAHHAISDGLSCVSLQSEILKYYQLIASGNPVDVDCVPPLPSLEELLPQWMKGKKHLEPPISHENMAFLASFLTSLHNIKPQMSFWDLSRNITKHIKLGLKRKDIFKPLMMMRKIVEYYIDHPEESQLTIAVTNIGRINISDVYGDLEIEEMSFVASNAIFGRILTISAATFNEKMFLNFTASKPSLSQDTIETLANSVINCLVEVCQEKVVMAVK